MSNFSTAQDGENTLRQILPVRSDLTPVGPGNIVGNTTPGRDDFLTRFVRAVL